MLRAILAVLLLFIATQARAEVASCYGTEHHQTRTAQGLPYNPWGMTAAMVKWHGQPVPFGTVVHVTNLRNGRSVTVRINDRGPYVRGRDIDLSLGACRAIGNSGVTPVSLSR